MNFFVYVILFSVLNAGSLQPTLSIPISKFSQCFYSIYQHPEWYIIESGNFFTVKKADSDQTFFIEHDQENLTIEFSFTKELTLSIRASIEYGILVFTIEWESYDAVVKEHYCLINEFLALALSGCVFLSDTTSNKRLCTNYNGHEVLSAQPFEKWFDNEEQVRLRVEQLKQKGSVSLLAMLYGFYWNCCAVIAKPEYVCRIAENLVPVPSVFSGGWRFIVSEIFARAFSAAILIDSSAFDSYQELIDSINRLSSAQLAIKLREEYIVKINSEERKISFLDLKGHDIAYLVVSEESFKGLIQKRFLNVVSKDIKPKPEISVFLQPCIDEGLRRFCAYRERLPEEEVKQDDLTRKLLQVILSEPHTTSASGNTGSVIETTPQLPQVASSSSNASPLKPGLVTKGVNAEAAVQGHKTGSKGSIAGRVLEITPLSSLINNLYANIGWYVQRSTSNCFTVNENDARDKKFYIKHQESELEITFSFAPNVCVLIKELKRPGSFVISWKIYNKQVICVHQIINRFLYKMLYDINIVIPDANGKPNILLYKKRDGRVILGSQLTYLENVQEVAERLKEAELNKFPHLEPRVCGFYHNMCNLYLQAYFICKIPGVDPEVPISLSREFRKSSIWHCICLEIVDSELDSVEIIFNGEIETRFGFYALDHSINLLPAITFSLTTDKNRVDITPCENTVTLDGIKYAELKRGEDGKYETNFMKRPKEELSIVMQKLMLIINRGVALYNRTLDKKQTEKGHGKGDSSVEAPQLALSGSKGFGKGKKVGPQSASKPVLNTDKRPLVVNSFEEIQCCISGLMNSEDDTIVDLSYRGFIIELQKIDDTQVRARIRAQVNVTVDFCIKKTGGCFFAEISFLEVKAKEQNIMLSQLMLRVILKLCIAINAKESPITNVTTTAPIEDIRDILIRFTAFQTEKEFLPLAVGDASVECKILERISD